MCLDHFAVLRQPRRPWLDPDQLKAQYQQLTFAHHPDRQQTDNDDQGQDFAAIAEAYRVLSSPKLRLDHLLSLAQDGGSHSHITDVPIDLADMFMEAATLVSQIDAYLRKRGAAVSALGRSLLQGETITLQKRAGILLGRLENANQEIFQRLREIDQNWTDDAEPETVAKLRSLAHRFGYLERWIRQLRERQFQLAN